MKRIYYNKLVRDKIPAVIKAAGSEYEVKILKSKKFEKELIKKVKEEASGLVTAKNREELIKEIGDVLDVIVEIKKIKKIKDSEIRGAQREAFKKKGGFKKKIFLIWSGDDGYKSNETSS
jgi:predicted house-cleaning noncanonical NTP pyrophosphatase (MazG superfamily)